MILVLVEVARSISSVMGKCNRLKVVIAIIVNDKQEILLTQRGYSSSYSEYWEFPGGKVEQGELESKAIFREIKEELGILLQSYYFWHQFDHQYEDKAIRFYCYIVRSYTGTPMCAEKQLALDYFNVQALKKLEFPPANIKIIDKIYQSKDLFWQ